MAMVRLQVDFHTGRAWKTNRVGMHELERLIKELCKGEEEELAGREG